MTARRQQKTITPEVRARCIAAGIGVERDYVVAARLGVSRQRVSILRALMGLPDPFARPRAARRARVSRLAQTDLSSHEIAAALGVSTTTVCLDRKVLGLPPAKVGGTRHATAAELIVAIQQGLTYAQIAARYGYASVASCKNSISKNLDVRAVAKAAGMAARGQRARRHRGRKS